VFRVIAQYFPVFEEHREDQAHAPGKAREAAEEGIPAGVG